MNLTFVQDYTSNISLDSQLMGTPDSGLYWNQGVHPLVTINNILTFLPNKDFTFVEWEIGATYNKYESTELQSDIVTYNNVIYQSLTASNIGNQPDISPNNWLETNIESIRIKTFLKRVENNMIGQLHLNRKLIENQYIYNVGEYLHTLPNDYSGWVFEPKGSDYVKIRINQIALQANTTDSVSLYVVNQGQLITTLTLNPNNGILQFEDVGYEFSGFGKFYFVFDSQEVKTDSPYNDPLKYNGFVVYPVNGIGAAPQSAAYSSVSSGNGMSFNLTARLDSTQYITNNIIDFSDMLRAQLEYDILRLMLHNVNNRVNSDQRNISLDTLTLNLLTSETINTEHLTVAKKYNELLKDTKASINKTLDRFLKAESTPKFRVNRRVI